jgi:hypothetical protein
VQPTHRKKPRARRFSNRPIRGDLSASMSVAGTLYTLPLQQHNTPARLKLNGDGARAQQTSLHGLGQLVAALRTVNRWDTTKTTISAAQDCKRLSLSLSACAGTPNPDAQVLLRPPYLFSTKLPSTALNSRYFVTSV